MSEADRPKRLRGKEGSGVITGVSPPGDRPVRMRGFYRAVRRGEEWAVRIEKLPAFSRLLALYLRNIDFREALAIHSYFSRIPKNDPWKGSMLIVPFKNGKEEDS